jgi:TonB-linked SusC/RagA family outer membrane protein
MKKLFMLTIGLFACTTLLAQRTVTGTVTDMESSPLPGVNVIVKGTNLGTVTDVEGKYSIGLAEGQDVLVFSYVGYVGQEVNVANLSVVDISMDADLTALEEIVVVGYGTQKKVNLTGSVEQVSGDALAKQPVMQASQALMGAAPGLTVIQSSGQPGRDVGTLRIRGIGSLGSGDKNSPLILIDGVQGDLNRLDPGDIEDISILKDAAASAIYGSRGANGVILVTTKRANQGKMTLTYRNYVGWQAVTDRPKFLGAIDFLENDKQSSQAVIDDYKANIGTDPDRYPDTDWVDELFSENGFMQYHQIGATGGTDRVLLAASLSYQDQNGNIPNFNFKRYNGRFNTDITLSEKVNMAFDLNFSQSVTKEPSQGLNLLTEQAFRIPPIYVGRHSDGSWGEGWAPRNPLPAAEVGGLNVSENNYFRGILKLNYSPVENLNVMLLYAPEYQDVFGKEFFRTYEMIMDWDTKETRIEPPRSSLSQSNTRLFTNNVNAIVTYDLDLNDHVFGFLAGYEMIKDTWQQFTAFRDQFVLEDYQVLNAGSQENDDNSGSATHSALQSYFGRVNYAFRDKYLFEANVRRDASSRFAPENRVSIFPSFSVGWRIAEESFFEPVGFLSDLKLRASWGQLGNQQIGSDFPYQSSIALGSNNFLFGNSIFTGATQNVLANRAIQWETTETTNIGLDASMLDSRLSVTAEYFIRKTNDILLQIPIPLVVGLSPSTQNAANVENRGWDLALGWQDNINDFKYNVRVIGSDFTNEVTNLAGVGPIISGNSIIEVGKPIESIFGYETQNIFQSQAEIDEAPAQFGALIPGNLRYRDQNEDGLINADDRVIIGNSFPKLSYAFDLGAEYKGFDLSINFQGVGKRDVLIMGDAVWALYNAGKIQEWHLEKSWTPENTDASFPVIWPTSSGSNDARASSTWVFNGAYLRLRNVNFGYSLPKSLLDGTFINYVRLYFSGQNLISWDKMPEGIDPMIPNGTTGAFYPIVQSYTFGIDVRF